MDDKQRRKDRLDDIPRWLKSDPELLADWLARDWGEDLRAFRAASGRESQAVIGGVRRPRPETGRAGRQSLPSRRRERGEVD
jgi:hypothetical protein